jgi:hypothetical protein
MRASGVKGMSASAGEIKPLGSTVGPNTALEATRHSRRSWLHTGLVSVSLWRALQLER